jgi:hypothetical protein
LTWNQWANSTTTTGETITISIRETSDLYGIRNDTHEITQMRTIQVDDHGYVRERAEVFTEAERREAEKVWLKFQPEFVKRAHQREQARANQSMQLRFDQARIEAEQRRLEVERQRYMDEARERERLWTESERARQGKLQQAEERAEKLLLENLSLKQRVEYLEHGHFTVEGRRARYRVRKARNINIDAIDRTGRITHRLCAYPDGGVPVHDVMLGQKLSLEANEEMFLGIAVEHGILHRDERVLPALQ